MKYCKICLLPDTRPNLVINSKGICNACNQYKNNKQKINWKKREQNFKQIVYQSKNMDKRE
mgnify:CR=1 FL=1